MLPAAVGGVETFETTARGSVQGKEVRQFQGSTVQVSGSLLALDRLCTSRHIALESDCERTGGQFNRRHYTHHADACEHTIVREGVSNATVYVSTGGHRVRWDKTDLGGRHDPYDGGEAESKQTVKQMSDTTTVCIGWKAERTDVCIRETPVRFELSNTRKGNKGQ